MPAFEDELRRLGVDHFDLGMLHYIDNLDELNACMQGEFYEYLHGRKEAGVVGHIGLSTHNPHVARAAVETGQVEAIMFSINPAFDMMPPSDDINTLFGDFGEAGEGIDPVCAHYAALPKTAADCIGCASCEPNCPFGVPIASRMAETAELFA